jgi:hypothetical protein
MLNYASHPGTPRCYRPIIMHTMTNITSPNMESPLIRLPLLEISKGLPPPDPSSGAAAALDVADVVVAATEPFFELEVELVVIAGIELSPFPPLADEVVEAIVEEVEDVDVDVVLVEVDLIVTETTELDLCEELVVKTADVDVEVVVFKPSPPVTP